MGHHTSKDRLVILHKTTLYHHSKINLKFNLYDRRLQTIIICLSSHRFCVVTKLLMKSTSPLWFLSAAYHLSILCGLQLPIRR